MTRVVLCVGLAALTLVLGILTAIVQAENHDRGERLNALKEECSMIEAINGDRSEQILERDFGPIRLDTWAPNAPKDAVRPTKDVSPVAKLAVPNVHAPATDSRTPVVATKGVVR